MLVLLVGLVVVVVAANPPASAQLLIVTLINALSGNATTNVTCTGGANIPALNELLAPFGVSLSTREVGTYSCSKCGLQAHAEALSSASRAVFLGELAAHAAHAACVSCVFGLCAQVLSGEFAYGSWRFQYLSGAAIKLFPAGEWLVWCFF